MFNRHFLSRLGENHQPTPWTSGAISALVTTETGAELEKVIFPHPVAEALFQRGKGADRVKQMKILAANDGMHAPLRLAMEERIMRRIQPRLPGLYSYHPLAAQLDGSLDDIDVTDFLNRKFKFN